jgi:hypothetical protein
MALINNNAVISQPQNVQTQFSDSFSTYNTTTGWSQSIGTGDIVQLDGNAVGSHYLVISKDPLTVSSETTVTTQAAFTGPLETGVGLSISQRVLGQETSLELVSTDTPYAAIADIAISSISQAVTTLTITTSSAHGLQSGARIGIYGVTSDSRLNYSSLVISSIVSTTSFTATAGPGGTITSITTAGPYTSQGYVYYRPAMGYAQEGMTEIFENGSNTNSSMYVRSDNGNVYPSGTINGNHSVTIATTASVPLISSAYTYSFVPTSEYKFSLQNDRAQFFDVPIDSTSQPIARLNRSVTVPSVSKTYKLRFRAINYAGLTVPNAKIVSAAKAGSTTATITTATAHGLTVGDYVFIVGIRNGTDFIPITTAVQIATVPTTTSFTLVYGGTSATVTSYGGFVARAQGSYLPAGFSASGAGAAIQSASLTSTELTLVSSGTFSLVTGDYVNVYGCRVDGTGADLGVDGVYKVANISTTTATLIPIGGTVLPTAFTSTNCGGAVIKRTDTRISYARILQALRERVEILNKSDASSGIPVTLNAGTVTTVGTVSSITAGSITPQSSNVYSLVTSTNLAASATYSGAAILAASSTTSGTQYNTQLVIGVSHTAGLTPGQLYLDVGTETSSTTPSAWYTALSVPIPSNANWQYFSVPLTTRYYRFRFANGATAQTNFRLSTLTTYNGGGLSGQMAFPMNIQYPLSTTALAANAVFTGVTMDFGDTMNAYQTITAIAFADQASAANGLQIQISRDGTTWRVAQQTAVVASTLTTITSSILYRYVRIVYTNGTTLQGSFTLDAQADAQ